MIDFESLLRKFMESQYRVEIYDESLLEAGMSKEEIDYVKALAKNVNKRQNMRAEIEQRAWDVHGLKKWDPFALPYDDNDENMAEDDSEDTEDDSSV